MGGTLRFFVSGHSHTTFFVEVIPVGRAVCSHEHIRDQCSADWCGFDVH